MKENINHGRKTHRNPARSNDRHSHRQLLRDYVDVAMLRDVVERHQVSDVLGLRWLVTHLLGNAVYLRAPTCVHWACVFRGLVQLTFIS